MFNQKTNKVSIIFFSILLLSGCKNSQYEETEIQAITNKSSSNCLHRDENGKSKPIYNCEIEGKLILTSPAKNLSYVLYRKSDTDRKYPVVCTLPAQAAEALTRIRKVNFTIPISKSSATAGGEKQDNSSIALLNKDDDMSPSLYVLSANFALCMSYGSNAIDDVAFKQLISKSLDNAVIGNKNITPTPAK
ncbi:TPA: hypothetical protein MYL57_005427 [Klebsiella variicola subsp. variicola]|uniref:hypothetical protein n=1 Tax=Klebsiella variicola TaxID=244366 RepID=UPI00190ECA4E|nr:hypothetical protein [Klebsiella variicola]HCB0645332.1 hypothetical protein [Klebsiella variicola subsp. variicola]